MIDRNYWRERARYWGDVYDVDFFERAIEQESGFNPHAVSSAGALGIAQFMPGTARSRGIDPRDPEQALRGSASLFREYLDEYGSAELALAAYNAGPGAVAKYKGVPPYPETQAYVRAILGPNARTDQPVNGGPSAPSGECPPGHYKNIFGRCVKGSGGFVPDDTTGNLPTAPGAGQTIPGQEGGPFDAIAYAIENASRALSGSIEGVRQGATQALIGVAVVGVAIVLAYGGARKMLG